jgi:hypothetical protein
MGRHQKNVTVDPETLVYGELMWAAGFFDGEGNFNFSLRNVTRKGEPAKYGRMTVQITQTDSDVLYRFKNAVGGLGAVTGPYEYKNPKSPAWTPLYRYQTSSPQEVIFIIRLLLPYLSSVKRKQAEEVMLRYSERGEFK